MRILLLAVIISLVGAVALAQTQAVTDTEGQKAELPQVQDQAQPTPQQTQSQTQESPRLPPSSGRYTFNRVDDGLIRLDNQSGEVAYCRARSAGWACEQVAIDRSASEKENASAEKQVALLEKLGAEITRLHDEMASLKKEIADLKEPPPPRPPADLSTSPKTDDIPVKLPTQQDIARAKDYLEGAWRRLVEMIVGLQKDIMRKG